MVFFVMDLEATCWERGTRLDRQEIIEIGAVKLNDDMEIVSEFDSFIKPLRNPELTDFCQNLTHILQGDVNEAHTFGVVFPKFLEWIGEDAYYLVTWGEYDVKLTMLECKRHSVEFPKQFEEKHINLKKKFARIRNTKRCSMKDALEIMNIPLEGVHHRGIDDARNIAKIGKVLLPQLIH